MLTPASAATSSRRRPGVRRTPAPEAKPTSAGVTWLRRARRKRPSSVPPLSCCSAAMPPVCPGCGTRASSEGCPVTPPLAVPPNKPPCRPAGWRGMLEDRGNARTNEVPGWSRAEMTDTGKTRAQELLGDTAPELARLTDEVLFGQVWADPGLSQRDRSLITVAALVSLGRTEQLRSHLRRALDNGLSKDELAAAMTHLA